MVSVTTTCRDINELTTNAKLACQLLFQECYKSGIVDIFITETYRSQERQNYLYAQGRTRAGKIVTWTLESNHKPRRAWDIAVSPPKSLYDNTTLNKVGVIAKKLGIVWGGTWTNNMDKPHFEIPPNWKLPKGYKLEGTVIVPISSSVKVQLIKNDKGELTMSEYKELSAKIKELEAQIKSKQPITPSRKASESHKVAWEWAIKEGLTNGENPQNDITREQQMTILKRFYDKYVK